MNSRTELILAELGVKPLWRLRQSLPSLEGLASANEVAILSEQTAGPVGEDLVSAGDVLQSPLGAAVCPCCGRSEIPVDELPSARADWIFIVGTDPLSPEVASVAGEAGRLLEGILSSAGLKRNENALVLAARGCAAGPQSARGEALCQAWLKALLAQVKPRVLLLFGAETQAGLLDEDVWAMSLPSLSALLVQPGQKAQVWDALCSALERYSGG